MCSRGLRGPGTGVTLPGRDFSVLRAERVEGTAVASWGGVGRRWYRGLRSTRGRTSGEGREGEGGVI